MTKAARVSKAGGHEIAALTLHGEWRKIPAFLVQLGRDDLIQVPRPHSRFAAGRWQHGVGG
jgi:hypothetical protein